ncbi:MAG: ArsR/SmtB family transcription factor [Candidatus Kariarchaeaceae archaeon]|jgi:predicted transcriptional regulator
MTDLQIDKVLEILSNRYRREILRLLTLSDRYAFELSKTLNISQRAVTNHLKFLQDTGLVLSEKRKSTKGPEREYFQLDQAVILSLTVAPNLFLAAVRSLGEDIPSPPITPSLQLSDKSSTLSDVLREGLQLLPQIRQGLDLLQAQQNKLLRGYQGLLSHVTDNLEKNEFTSKEIRLILLLMENDGEATREIIEIAMGEITYLSDVIKSLKEKNIIQSRLNAETDDLVLILTLELVT